MWPDGGIAAGFGPQPLLWLSVSSEGGQAGKVRSLFCLSSYWLGTDLGPGGTVKSVTLNFL